MPFLIKYKPLISKESRTFSNFFADPAKYSRNLSVNSYLAGSYLLHPKTFHPRTLILKFSSLPFILNNSSFLFNPLDFSFTNSSPPFYPTPCNLFQIICYISYPLNSYSSKWDLLFHTFNLIHNISSSSNHSFDFISLIWSCIFKT